MTRLEILEILIAQMRAIIPEVGDREINEEKSLVLDFGADSLQVVEIVSRTMKLANVRVRRTELSKARTIGALLDLLCNSNA